MAAYSAALARWRCWLVAKVAYLGAYGLDDDDEFLGYLPVSVASGGQSNHLYFPLVQTIWVSRRPDRIGSDTFSNSDCLFNQGAHA